jgi:DNA-binding transcriptional LysR family regulator
MLLSDRIGRRVKLQDLRVLMVVVQAGSMRKAAVQLNTTQPSVSRSIAELEAAVGVRLLDRDPAGVELTEYGRALLDGGTAMFDDLRQAVKKIEFLADPEAGEVRIGSGHHHAASFVFVVVERLARRHPRMVFHLTSANTTELLESELYARTVDLLVARRWGSISDERLGFEHLFNDPNFVVAGTRHPLARRRRIEPAELINQSWVLPPPESPPGAAAVEAFRASGLDYPRVTVFAILPEVRIRLLLTGRFLTIFSNSVLANSKLRSIIRFLPVRMTLPHIPTGIVTLKNRTLSPAAKLFIEQAREVAKSLAANKS